MKGLQHWRDAKWFFNALQYIAKGYSSVALITPESINVKGYSAQQLIYGQKVSLFSVWNSQRNMDEPIAARRTAKIRIYIGCEPVKEVFHIIDRLQKPIIKFKTTKEIVNNWNEFDKFVLESFVLPNCSDLHSLQQFIDELAKEIVNQLSHSLNAYETPRFENNKVGFVKKQWHKLWESVTRMPRRMRFQKWLKPNKGRKRKP